MMLRLLKIVNSRVTVPRGADHLGNFVMCEHLFNARGFSAAFEQQICQPAAGRLW